MKYHKCKGNQNRSADSQRCCFLHLTSRMSMTSRAQLHLEPSCIGNSLWLVRGTKMETDLPFRDAAAPA
eukprot:1157975-Pelagomonas_calceolata.AAC.2